MLSLPATDKMLIVCQKKFSLIKIMVIMGLN